MNLKDIVNYTIITSDINSSLENISKTMKEADIGFMPITKDNIIIGVITDRDIVVRGLANNIDELNNLISTNIISIDITSSIDEVLEQCSKNKVKRVLVKENDKYIGVLSISDILKLENSKRVLDTLRNIFSENKIDSNAERDEFEL